MLNEYTPLMAQAEKLQKQHKGIHYDEALTMLNQNKVNRLSNLESELGTVMELLLVELKKTGTIDDKNLILGTFQSFQVLNENFQLLSEILLEQRKAYPDKEKMLELQTLLDRKVYKIKDSYQQHFNYKAE